jgi:protein TonB
MSLKDYQDRGGKSDGCRRSQFQGRVRMTIHLAALLLASSFDHPAPPPPAADAEQRIEGCESVVSMQDYVTRGGSTPAAIVQPRPEYPRAKLMAGEDGFVLLEVVIGTEGKVMSARIAQASDAMFAKASIDATTGWRYASPQLDGKPVCVSAHVPIRFQVE